MILIAAGTRPAIPKIKGLATLNYVTSDEALRIVRQPGVLTIIGGGYIAAELKSLFRVSWNKGQHNSPQRNSDT